MALPARRLLPALLTALALLAAGCGSGPDPGRPVESLELVDLTAPGMFLQVARQLGEPNVLELPPIPIAERHDLEMSDTTEREVLEAIAALDERFQHSMDGPALLFWPTGDFEAESPYSRRLAVFRAEGSVDSVLRELISAALPENTILVAEQAGRARPVELDLADLSVREALGEIAAQAHLTMTVEPGYVRVSALSD